MTRQERAFRLVYQDGTTSRAITRDGAGHEWPDPNVAEIVKVVRRKSGAFTREEANT